MFDSYAAPEAPIGGHVYWQQVGVKVILASMQQKVGISVSALCVHSVCALCALCVHDVCTMYARCMHDVCTSAQHIVVVRAHIVRAHRGAHGRRS